MLPTASCQGPPWCCFFTSPSSLNLLSTYCTADVWSCLPSFLPSSHQSPQVKSLLKTLSETLSCPWPFLLCSFLHLFVPMKWNTPNILSVRSLPGFIFAPFLALSMIKLMSQSLEEPPAQSTFATLFFHLGKEVHCIYPLRNKNYYNSGAQLRSM